MLGQCPPYAANISCFNPADASEMTEPEWRAAGFLAHGEIPDWDDLPVMTPEEAQRAGAVNGFDPDAYLADTSCSGLLSGDIVKGDYEKVATFFDVHRPKMFALNSNGGDVDEALKIGRLFRKFLILTLVPTQPWYCSGEECVCASACALIWFGGIDRGGGVGLHRPRSRDPKFGKLSPVDATTEYRRELERINAYLDEMEVPKTIIDSMVTTDFSDIRWVYSFLDGLVKPPSIAEWEEASCSSNEKHDRCVHLLLTSTRDHLFSSAHFQDLAVRWLWRSLLAVAVIVFLVWLIRRLPNVLPATVIALRLQKLQVTKLENIKRVQIVLTAMIVPILGGIAVRGIFDPSRHDYQQAMVNFQHHPIAVILGALAPSIIFTPIGYLMFGWVLRRNAARFKICEHCAEAIKAEAKVCRYCGRDVAPARQVEVKVRQRTEDELRQPGAHANRVEPVQAVSAADVIARLTKLNRASRGS
jgi:hypothetical protein